MRDRILRVLVLACLLAGCILPAGCRRGFEPPSGPPPTPPEPVNARLPNHIGLGGSDSPDANGDTRIVGRCVASDEYGVVRHGDWNDHWMLVRVQVLNVEKGHWGRQTAATGENEPNGPQGSFVELRFVAMDTWPTPESGIMIDKGPWAYRKGSPFAFSLDTSHRPAVIVGQQGRSIIDPNNPPHQIDWPNDQAKRQAFGKKLDEAVNAYNVRVYGKLSAKWMSYPEETADAYVVQVGRGGDVEEILLIDKKTFEAKPLGR